MHQKILASKYWPKYARLLWTSRQSSLLILFRTFSISPKVSYTAPQILFHHNMHLRLNFTPLSISPLNEPPKTPTIKTTSIVLHCRYILSTDGRSKYLDRFLSSFEKIYVSTRQDHSVNKICWVSICRRMNNPDILLHLEFSITDSVSLDLRNDRTSIP